MTKAEAIRRLDEVKGTLEEKSVLESPTIAWKQIDAIQQELKK